MKLILFLDARGGMLFNHRRQSQDRYAREYILKMTEGARLLMNPYSAKQFKEGAFTVTETPKGMRGRMILSLLRIYPFALMGLRK